MSRATVWGSKGDARGKKGDGDRQIGCESEGDGGGRGEYWNRSLLAEFR